MLVTLQNVAYVTVIFTGKLYCSTVHHMRYRRHLLEVSRLYWVPQISDL